MRTIKLDLVDEYAINIGSTYKIQIRLCNFPDLTECTGSFHIKKTINDEDVLVTGNVHVLNSNIFELEIPHTNFINVTESGNFVYDVLFSHDANADRFYPIGGKCQLVKRVTTF